MLVEVKEEEEEETMGEMSATSSNQVEVRGGRGLEWRASGEEEEAAIFRRDTCC